jgi:hypothetical protein
MIEFTKYDTTTRRITGFFIVSTASEAEASLSESEAIIKSIWDADTHYIAGGHATPRPSTGLPATYTIAASTDWTISDVPAGTEVEIDGEAMGITDDTGLTLSFDVPGVWPVTLRPPFPWIKASCEVTVT